MDLLVVTDYSGLEAAPVEVPEPPTLLGRRLEGAPSTTRAEPIASTACKGLPATTLDFPVGSLEKFFRALRRCGVRDWLSLSSGRAPSRPHVSGSLQVSVTSAIIQFSPLFLYLISFLFVIEHMMPLCMVISWVYSVAMMIQHIVTEKEHRLKEVGMVEEILGEEWAYLSPTFYAVLLVTFLVFLGYMN